MPERSTFLIPLPHERDVLVAGDFPLTDQEWDQFMAVLEAMKPGLVKSEMSGQGEVS